MSDKHFTARVPPVTTRTYTAKVKVGPSIPITSGVPPALVKTQCRACAAA